MRRIQLSAVIMLPLAALLASCGSSAKSSTPTSTSGPATTAAATVTTAPASPADGPAIMIQNADNGFAFTTSPVKAGATVTVKNNTTVQHTVSANTTAGGFDVTVDPGKTMTFTAPKAPGAYKFHCNIHTYMMGTLTVT